jgi:predicted chitinase
LDIDLIKRKLNIMSAELDQLEVQVAETTSVEQSAITLIRGIAAQLAAAGTDPVKLKALSDSLNTSEQALAQAVAENTPATPPTP